MGKKISSIIEATQKALAELLAQIKSVNFHEKAGLKKEGKVKLTRYVVITVRELIKISEANNWGLCFKNERIYVFNGQYWSEIAREDFKKFLGKVAVKMGVPELDAEYYKFNNDLYDQFLSKASLPTMGFSSSVLINLQNGTFEINENGQYLREFRREDFLTYQLPFEYDPAAKCPTFYKYLRRVLPDIGCRKVLAEFIAYIFTNNLKLEKALLLYGKGANGKSVFFEIATAILGDENTCSYSLQELTKSGSYQLAELATKLVNYTSEISRNMNTTIFKQLVSNEAVGVRPIYGQPFTMRNYSCKLIFNCNDLPRDVEQNEAFPRRLIIIPFEQTIPKQEQDHNLANKIIDSELSGVFNWVQRGLSRLLEQGNFSESKKIQDALDTYCKESDSVALFIEEQGLIPSISETILLQEVYEEYSRYCFETGYKACSKRIMSERLDNLGIRSEKKRNGKVVCVERIKDYSKSVIA